MTADRVHNFNPGPAALPLSVLTEIQENFTNFAGTGMSISEVSHRSKPFEVVINDAVARVKRLLGLGEEFHVLFLQGGASLQFAMIPMNFLPVGRSADYVNTGTWATKAIKECELLGKAFKVVASSEDREFRYIPKEIAFNLDAAYAHITSNNTIRGTQWAAFPHTGAVPLVADMSSDIMSRPFDPKPFGLIYAGAQKNIGPAGVTLAIVRQDFLAKAEKRIPTMLRYSTFSDKNSLYNTPPCFAIYTVQLVLKWLEESIGGLSKMAAINREKAQCLYSAIDKSGFYSGTADADSRSQMNITFRLATAELEARFIDEAAKAGLVGLKGHRSVGGCRASLYNAVSLASVQVLWDFMTDFERRNG